MPQSLRSVFAFAFCCCGCDYTALSAAVGEHVVYHWDGSEEQLCGGTVAVADRFVEAIPAYYGSSLENRGPNIQYFWGLPGQSSACAWGGASECSVHLLTGFTVFSEIPLNTHELAHTAKGGYGQPDFVNEGFATRWEQSELLGGVPWRTAPSAVSEVGLRAQFALHLGTHVDYVMAHAWWVALETHYGPSKMGKLIEVLEGSGSAGDVEAALQQVLGISLAESAALAASLPELFLDDPVCELAGLPTLVWNGEPLVVEREHARCDDDDVVNLRGQRVSWLFALDFPMDWVAVDVEVTVPDNADLQQKSLVLSWCDGEISLDHMSATHFSAAHPDAPSTTKYLGGHYVAALWGVLQADGSVEFPRAEFKESSP